MLGIMSKKKKSSKILMKQFWLAPTVQQGSCIILDTLYNPIGSDRIHKMTNFIYSEISLFSKYFQQNYSWRATADALDAISMRFWM